MGMSKRSLLCHIWIRLAIPLWFDLQCRLTDSFMPTTVREIFWRRRPKGGYRILGKIGRAHSELQSLMRISYAVFCLKKKKTKKIIQRKLIRVYIIYAQRA